MKLLIGIMIGIVVTRVIIVSASSVLIYTERFKETLKKYYD